MWLGYPRTWLSLQLSRGISISSHEQDCKLLVSEALADTSIYYSFEHGSAHPSNRPHAVPTADNLARSLTNVLIYGEGFQVVG